MKRDMELIRRLMTDLEEAPPGQTILGSQLLREGVHPQELAEYLSLLLEQRYLEGKALSSLEGLTPELIVIQRITWKGHEFIASIRDDTVWQKTKERVMKAGGSVSLSVITEVAGAVAKSMMGLA